jgi:DNA-binding CsgD family transcriptional regulator
MLGMLAALAGDEDGCLAWLAENRRLGSPSAHGNYRANYLALLDLSRGRFGQARERLAGLLDTWWGGTDFMFLPDLIEAAARSGHPDMARRGLARFQAWLDMSGQPWARAVARRCQALVSDNASAEAHYRAAVTGPEQDGRPFERARTHLVYGEWLRRARRRSDARFHLTAAHRIFQDLGALAWAQRAAGELAAAGAPPPARAARPPGVLARLTPQELQVAQLAADGLSNRDIGAQLFLSPRTVGYHLYKAYPKLGIGSRAELARLLAEEES